MNPPSPRRPLLLIGLAAAAVVLTASGCAAWRIGQAAELARQSEPWQHRPAQPAMKLLVVGDSTAVGTGASRGEASLAGLLSAALPGLAIDNRARDGATWADLLPQLAGDAPVDMVLIQAGGNDVIRLRDMDAVRQDLERVLQRARERAPLVVVMPAGNVGNAPFFFPPLSWWMSARSRELHAAVRETAARHGAVYVGLYQEARDDPFVRDRGLNARDGLHPSDAGYRVWFDELMRQAELPRRLAAAARAP